MGIVTDFLVKIDWGDPSLVLAGVSFLILVVFSGKKFRTSTMGVLSTIFGAGGFLLAGWVGVFTFSLAVAYRTFYRLKGKQQFFVTVVAGFVLFSVLSFLIAKVDPEAAAERRDSPTGSVAAKITDTVGVVADNAGKVFFAVAGVGVLVALLVVLRKYRRKNPYRRMGLNVDTDQMYRGMVNPNLTPVSEANRDPERSFPAKMRAMKLKEQKGYCAYARLSVHPNWEPYREGVQWEGDHIVPHAVGGATNFVNLQMLCADCNSAKSSKMFDEAERAVEARWRAKKAEKHP